MTELLFLTDGCVAEFDAVVRAVDGPRVALDRTAFDATGGGQPHDTGRLGQATVTDVRQVGGDVWHTLDGPAPAIGATVHRHLDWDRRHVLMRTHSALPILGGVIWHEWSTAVTGGNMEPLSARMDFVRSAARRICGDGRRRSPG
jgi:misacylated tRNA(Ala) deacylase